MIPKKIHYCWFGGNPLPELAQKCISSWKKYCPDYEIIEWNAVIMSAKHTMLENGHLSQMSLVYMLLLHMEGSTWIQT